MTPDKVEERIEEIKRRYKIGRAILKDCPERFARTQLAQVAEQHGVNRPAWSFTPRCGTTGRDPLDNVWGTNLFAR